MSGLFWPVIVLGGLVSTFAAMAITSVILLVLGQVGVLAYRRVRTLSPSTRHSLSGPSRG